MNLVPQTAVNFNNIFSSKIKWRIVVLVSLTAFWSSNIAKAELFIVNGDHCPATMKAASGCSAAGLTTSSAGVCCSDAIALVDPTKNGSKTIVGKKPKNVKKE